MDPLFQSHKLNPGGLAKVEFTKNAFDDLLSNIKAHVPLQTREFSIVKTKLEEACMYAVKAIALDPANQKS